MQLIAFPVFSGTSVHLEGGVTAILLEPCSALLISFCTLLLQALLFQHGGIISLGANFLNIGIVNSFIGYFLWKIKSAKIISAIAVVIATIISAIFCVLESSLSNRIKFTIGLATMCGTHTVAGIIEGMATFFILLFIEKVKPGISTIEKNLNLLSFLKENKIIT